MKMSKLCQDFFVIIAVFHKIEMCFYWNLKNFNGCFWFYVFT